jgi:hypothetical protein
MLVEQQETLTDYIPAINRGLDEKTIFGALVLAAIVAEVKSRPPRRPVVNPASQTRKLTLPIYTNYISTIIPVMILSKWIAERDAEYSRAQKVIEESRNWEVGPDGITRRTKGYIYYMGQGCDPGNP